MNIVSRPMCCNDLSTVAEIEQETSLSPWTLQTFKDCLDFGHIAYVFEVSKTVCAFALISNAAGEAHVLNVAVKPEQQGQGLGTFILQHIIQVAKFHSAETIYLEVRVSNQKAIRLYERHGFIEISKRKDYYKLKDGLLEDALVFALSLVSISEKYELDEHIFYE